MKKHKKFHVKKVMTVYYSFQFKKIEIVLYWSVRVCTGFKPTQQGIFLEQIPRADP